MNAPQITKADPARQQRLAPLHGAEEVSGEFEALGDGGMWVSASLTLTVWFVRIIGDHIFLNSLTIGHNREWEVLVNVE